MITCSFSSASSYSCCGKTLPVTTKGVNHRGVDYLDNKRLSLWLVRCETMIITLNYFNGDKEGRRIMSTASPAIFVLAL